MPIANSARAISTLLLTACLCIGMMGGCQVDDIGSHQQDGAQETLLELEAAGKTAILSAEDQEVYRQGDRQTFWLHSKYKRGRMSFAELDSRTRKILEPHATAPYYGRMAAGTSVHMTSLIIEREPHEQAALLYYTTLLISHLDGNYEKALAALSALKVSHPSQTQQLAQIFLEKYQAYRQRLLHYDRVRVTDLFPVPGREKAQKELSEAIANDLTEAIETLTR